MAYFIIQKSKSWRVTTISISADDFIPLRRCIFRRRNLFSWHVYKYENRLYIHNSIYIYIYIHINIMRGKKDATTFPDKPVSWIASLFRGSFFPLIIFNLLCFNVLSTVPRENRLADFLHIHIYIFNKLWNNLNKRINSHNFKMKNIWIYLQLLSLPFTYWIKVNLRTLSVI